MTKVPPPPPPAIDADTAALTELLSNYQIEPKKNAKGIDPSTQGEIKVIDAKGNTIQIDPYKGNVKKFENLNCLRPELIDACAAKGFKEPSLIQAQALPLILKKHHSNDPKLPEYTNFIGQAHHGSGKTATFTLAVLQRVNENDSRLQAIVLCHTRELAIQTKQVFDELRKFIPNFKILLGVPGKWETGRNQPCQIVIGTPGTIWFQVLDQGTGEKTPDLTQVKMVVIDEADELLRYRERTNDSYKKANTHGYNKSNNSHKKTNNLTSPL